MRPAGDNPARRFFEARSVAVVGASRTPGKAGFHQVDNLRRHYSGEVFPVNPNADRIAGYRCYPSLEAIERPVDLAILLRPPGDVLPSLEACIAKEIRAVLVPAAGFAEASEEGEALQVRMVQRARESGVAVWGPNCGGFVNTANGLLASFIDLPRVRKGGVGIVAQSGIYVAGLFNQLMERSGFGVSTVASLGNACDVSAADVFEYLAEDPATSVIALHLEGLAEGARLLRTARSLAGRKPVVAAVVGGTESGAGASRSHTANLAVPGRIADGLLAQAGIAPARESVDLVELAGAYALMGTPRPARRVATISTSGGAGVIVADCADEFGVEMARLAPTTRDRLGAVHPFARGVDNPIDAWPAMERHGTAIAVHEIADAVFCDRGVDAVVFAMGAYSGGGADFDPAMVGGAHARSGKPAVAWLYGPSSSLDKWRRSLEAIGIPCFGDLRGAVAALAGWDRMYRRGREPLSPNPSIRLEGPERLRVAVRAAHAVTDAARVPSNPRRGGTDKPSDREPGEPEERVAAHPCESTVDSPTSATASESSSTGDSSARASATEETARAESAALRPYISLSEKEALDFLDTLGVRTVPRERVRTPEDAVSAASRLGFPVVLKAVSRDLAHKTEVGAVAVGIDSGPALRTAWRTIADSVATRAPNVRLDGMMVQSMLHGREVIAGVTRAPGIGPVVMVGCGGVLVESRGEVAFRLPPLDRAEADRMMEESGVARVLGAHRGSPAGDRTAVRDLLVRIAALADARIGIHEFEINPLVVGEAGEGATAADALVVVEGS